MNTEKALQDALVAAKESRKVDFKSEFDPTRPGAWCELVKDIAAFANSGGGVILFGLDDSGKGSGWNPEPLLTLDVADIGNQVWKYTSEHFDGFTLQEHRKGRKKIAALTVAPKTGSPLVFVKPGTYQTVPGKQATAFSRGTVYFRHGAKSEPGTSRDLERFISAEVARLRKDWFRNVRRVFAAPNDAEVVLLSPRVGPSERANRFRIVDDPSAPAVARTDFDITHPYRQKELVKTINDRLGKDAAGPYEIQCVRKVHGVDTIQKFFHRPKFGSPQYSDAFVSWLISEYQRDPGFFEKAKEASKLPN